MMLKTRVITSVFFVAVLIVVFFLFNTIIFELVFTLICLMAVYEVYRAYQFGQRSLYIYIGFVPVLIIILLQDYLSVRTLLLPVIFAFLLFIVINIIIHVNTLNFSKLSGLSVFAMVLVFCFYSIISLKSLLPGAVYGYDAIYFIALIFAYAWGGDTMAYFVGMKFGKHKLAPQVSPKKTVEGAIGGIFGSMILGIVVTFIYLGIFRQTITLQVENIVYYIVVALFSIAGSLLGLMGDLFASAIKRQCSIKDFGTIFPGHGGILDRFDSLMLIAPLVSMAVRLTFYYFID